MQVIPGASAIGRGFNILGTYSTRSLMPQIVNLGAETSTFEYPPTGYSYAVPENTSPVEYTNTTGSSYVYKTVEQFQGHFSQKAQVSATYGAFSGQFNLAYSNTVNTDQSYYYCGYEADFTAWELNLNHSSTQWQNADFKDDPDIKNLPTTFTPQNQEQFFAVFRKWGTHLVAQVIVGGSMDYYEAVQSAYYSDETQVNANVKLEYKAVFTSGKAESQTEWEQLGKSWADHREVTVNATGGDTSLLNSLQPGYMDSDVGVMDLWSSAVLKNPSVVEFTLRPLNVLFSGDQAFAVSAALEAYTNGAILTYADTDYTPNSAPGGGQVSTSWGIVTNGNVAVPDPAVTPPPPTVVSPGVVAPVGGYQIALYDPLTLEPFLVHLYYQTYLANSLQPDRGIYEVMLKDLKAVTKKGYLAALSGFAVDLMNTPTNDFNNWLISVGCTGQAWKKFVGYNNKGGSGCYVVLGRQGAAPGQALELLKAVYEVSWVDQPYYFTIDSSAIGLTYGRGANVLTDHEARGALPEPPKESKK
ncbi:MAC/perforin domain-containing protein [Nocardia sp. NPDC088792]|uniref:MAC/perforin domain-containing protein n=1 Tax=Nocardia sp. NPDC088792 TaxID=3364332 RepID=UPI0037FD0E8C